MTLVQMLVAALLAYGSSVAAHAMALHLCSQALEIVWPPDTDPAWSAAERQLPRRAWLPAFPDAASAAAAAAQQPLSAAACALDADLRAHCPDVTLGALRCLALQLRLMVLGHLGKTQHPSRERLALQQQSLIDCQMLMSLGAAGRPSADVKAASNAAARLLVYLHGELLLFSSQPELVPAGRGAEALAAEALRRTVADRSECVHVGGPQGGSVGSWSRAPECQPALWQQTGSPAAPAHHLQGGSQLPATLGRWPHSTLAPSDAASPSWACARRCCSAPSSCWQRPEATCPACGPGCRACRCKQWRATSAGSRSTAPGCGEVSAAACMRRRHKRCRGRRRAWRCACLAAGLQAAADAPLLLVLLPHAPHPSPRARRHSGAPAAAAAALSGCPGDSQALHPVRHARAHAAQVRALPRRHLLVRRPSQGGGTGSHGTGTGTGCRRQMC